MATFSSSLKSKLIYIFAINDEWHQDCLKIGETTLDEDNGEIPAPCSPVLDAAARKRINEYTQTAGIAYQLLYTEMTVYFSGRTIMSFNDNQVHMVLERSGIKKKIFDQVERADEWYCCDLETAKKAIRAVKQGKTSLLSSEISHGQTPIIFRPEQRKAIDMTIKQFRKGKQMLWNAKMRFGKTLSALQVVKEEEYARTLILTHRPVVDKGWFDDFGKIFYDSPTYHYGSRTKGESFASLQHLAQKGDKFVYFASMQDLRGSYEVGGKFDKDSEIFATTWDMLIIDEAHEGTKTNLGTSVINRLTKKDHTNVLRLSGTPFNLLGDFKENEVFTWDYIMEQRAKTKWDNIHHGDHNPYAELPSINIYTYNLGRLLKDYADDEKAFNFREFFRTRGDGTFVHNKDIDSFLDLLCKNDDESLYPYSCDKFRQIFRHTLWILPGVAAAKALSAKLHGHPVFGNFQIVNVAGNGDEDEENADALEKVNNAITEDPGATWTITLSCGKLTTGVSVKPWTAVFMMAGSFSTSAAGYMQTIFRVQTPFTYQGKMKTECYAFDFAPDRTLRVLAETAHVSAKVGKQSEGDRKILGEFLNFCPIISIEGSQMHPYNVNSMMGQLKRAQIERVVRGGFEDSALYNDNLLQLSRIDLVDFKNLKGIIGSTKAMAKTSDIDINNQGFTDEEYDEKEKLDKKPKHERTPEEQARLEELKKKQTQRRKAISILRGISIRMPLLIFGAELKDEKDEITIDNFTEIVDDESWTEFMPAKVDKSVFAKFKRYYDPDVFREAGRRIREMARAADKFTIEERIARIAAIFQTFHNPDKETVLTPWKVVNMHMGDCLGGFCFYNEDYSQELEVPRFIFHEGVTDEVFNSKSKILEINSKTGLYPLYCAYNIYRSRVEAAKKQYGEIDHSLAFSLWNATLEQNIFVVCKTPMARSITRRTLAGFRPAKTNTEYYRDIITNITENQAAVVNTLHDGKHFWHINNDENMKFNAVVGNPPYNIMDGSGASDDAGNPIYQEFVRISKELHPKFISLIMPSKWMIGGKAVLKGFREEMMKDVHISHIFDFENDREIFENARNDGGICFFLWDKDYDEGGKVHYAFKDIKGHVSKDFKTLKNSIGDIIIRDAQRSVIISKVLKEDESISNIISKTKPFGIRKDLFNKPERYPNANTSDKAFDNSIKIYGVKGIKGGARRKEAFVSKRIITKNIDWVNQYKLFFTTSYSTNAANPPEDIESYPGSACTETFIVIGPFKTEEEMSNCHKYLHTTFAKALLYFGHGTMQVTAEVFQFIPLQNFTSSSDINWEQSIADIDRQLYRKYGLNDEEVSFIERIIKPMESRLKYKKS